MTPKEGFESAQFLVAWANTQFQELDVLLKSFGDSSPGTVLKEFNPKNGMTVKVRFSPIPHRIRGLANNIVKDLRDALDQATFAATLHITGSGRKRNAHFPFGSSPADFDRAISLNQCRDIPPELYPVLKSFEPYPTGDDYAGGNNYLRLLGQISGPHKHRFTLAPAVDVATTQISNFYFSAGDDGMELMPGDGVTKNNEYVLIRGGRGSEGKFDLSLSAYVAFADAKMKGIPVGDFLRECCSTVGYIVQEIQAQSLRIRPRS